MSELTNIYQALHQIPELGYCERKTKAYIMEYLGKLNWEITEIGSTALLAYFDKHSEHTLAFRCEMDALPVKEENTFDYASKHKGYMHACGHDAHMAMLLSLAQEISLGMAESLYNVILIFQSAEELSGGALQIVESTWLEQYRCEAILALHIWPGLEEGKVYSREGYILAGSDEIDLQIVGEGCHIAEHLKGHDALLACADLVLTFKEAKEAGIESFCYFGKMECGRVRNVVAQRASLQGTLRYFTLNERSAVLTKLEDVANLVDKRYGTHTQIQSEACNIPVVNNPELFKKLQSNLSISLCSTYYQSEDFGRYAKIAPTFFGLLGGGTMMPALHSSHFSVEESVLKCGLSFYKEVLIMPIL